MSEAPLPLNRSQVDLLRLVSHGGGEFVPLTGPTRTYLFAAAKRLAARGLLIADRTRPRWFKLTDAGTRKLAVISLLREQP